MIAAKLQWRSPGVLLCLILLLAAVLRIARLDTLPPALFRDEAEKAYNAYSLLKTGRDVEGRLLPLFLHVFGVTTSAIYQYAAIPFVAVFGLNEWGARLPAAVIGLLTVAMTFLLGREFRGARVGLWAALLLALSPWHIVFSRWAQQGIFLPLLLSIGAYGVVRYSKCEQPQKRDVLLIIIAAAAFGCAMYAYDVARLFVPAVLICAIICYWPAIKRRPRVTGAAILAFAIAAAPTVWLLVASNEAAQARFRFVSIVQPGVTPLQAVRTFLGNYLAHWSPDFLLLHGDPELRHGAGIGVLTLLEFIAVLAGVIALIRERRRANWFWIAWLILFPVAASLTRIGIPHALRTIVALPAMQIVAAIGIEASASGIRPGWRKMFEQLLLLLAFLSAVPFGLRYFSRAYTRASAIDWQFGTKQALQILNQPNFAGATVYLHNIVGAEFLVPFYTKANPHQVQAAWSNPPERFGRYVYMPFQQPDRLLRIENNSPAAYITVPGPYTWPADWRPIAIYTADDPGEPPALFIYLNPALRHAIE